jgi:hypothetical protein
MIKQNTAMRDRIAPGHFQRSRNISDLRFATFDRRLQR